MVTANQKKFVKSLTLKKNRTAHGCFVVEGVKLVDELLLSNFEVKAIYATSNWLMDNLGVEAQEVSNKDLASMSSFKTSNEVLAVVNQKQPNIIDLTNGLVIALDNLQDPGNFGTIIRTADWFGIKNIVCSTGSVDIYNPKVIQATMGSLFRVNLVYTDLMELFSQNEKITVYGAVLDGENIYAKTLSTKSAVILMGNESKGISSDLLPFVTDKIKIPGFGSAESLNVATATAVICSEFKRNA